MFTPAEVNNDTDPGKQITRGDNKMRLVYRSFVVSSLLMVLPLFAFAQTNEQLADLNDAIEMVRSMAALERRAVIAEQLRLTGEESTKFWPIYDDYAMDKKRVNDRLIKIITDYGANFENLSDELATSLVDDHMDVQSDLLKLRSRYLRKFDRVLAPKTLARFYQLENKFDAVTNVVSQLSTWAKPTSSSRKMMTLGDPSFGRFSGAHHSCESW